MTTAIISVEIYKSYGGNEMPVQKKRKREKERKIDMSYHDYKIKSLGMSDRAKKHAVRFFVFILPLAFLIFWLIKTMK